MGDEKQNVSTLKNELYQPLFQANWHKYTLYNLAEWVNGLPFRNLHFTPQGKPVIKIAEIKNGISGQTKFTEKIYDPVYHVTAGEMLFSWSGQPETSIDVFKWRGPDGWLNQHIFKVHPKEGCEGHFFFYLLKYLNPNFVKIARNKQTTGLGHVTKKDLKNITVKIPDLPEQRAIAHILGSLDDKIELNRRMNKTLEATARAIFKSWFVDFDPVHAKAEGRPTDLPGEIAALFPDSFEDSEMGEIPKGWEVLPFPEIIDVNPARTLKKEQIAPYLEMKNMPENSARALDWYNRKFGSGVKFINGDTLMARITPCLENGKGAFVDFLENGEVGWGSTEYIVFRVKKPLPLEYSYFLSRTTDFRSHAIVNMTGSSGRQRVPASVFESYLVVRPSEKIVKYFGMISGPIMDKIKKNDEESRTLASLRDTLLPKLISGELRIQKTEKFLENVI